MSHDDYIPHDGLEEEEDDRGVVVFTNGVFDLFHFGHLTFLEHAKAQGDYLIVGINSDFSVKNLKGTHRPIIPQHERMRIIAALECVDEVIIFDELDACDLIEELEPDIYIKSEEYADMEALEFTAAQIAGADIMIFRPDAYVREVRTTKIIERIVESEIRRKAK